MTNSTNNRIWYLGTSNIFRDTKHPPKIFSDMHKIKFIKKSQKHSSFPPSTTNGKSLHPNYYHCRNLQSITATINHHITQKTIS